MHISERLLQYFSSVLAGRVINNAPKIWELMSEFLQTRELLCHAFKGTWHVTELAISISKNCFELSMVSKYQSLSILTSLSQNFGNTVTLQWLISRVVVLWFLSFLGAGGRLVGLCFLFLWGFFAVALLFYPSGLK